MPAVLPTAITGLVGWWKADALTGLADNDDITSWPDSSGNGYTLTPVGGRNPTYKTAILDGKPVVRMAAADSLQTANFAAPLSADSTVIVVAREVTNAASSRYLFDSKDVSNRRYFYRASSSVMSAGSSGGMNATGMLLTGWSIVTVEYSDTGKIRQGGVLLASGTDINANPMAGLTVGARYSGTAEYWDGDIAEFILFDRLLTDAEHLNISTYLRQKYGSLQGEYDFGTLIRRKVPTTKVETFTASDTFTLDPRAREVIVQCVGGGGGGGSGGSRAVGVARNAGGGGGGSALAQAAFAPADLTATVSVTVGAAGAGGASVTGTDVNGNDGSIGGTSSFGAYLSAVGGNRGPGGLTATPTAAATTGPQTDSGSAGGAQSGGGSNLGPSQGTSRGPTGGSSGRGLTSSNAGGGGATGGTHNIFGATVGGAGGVAAGGAGGSGPTVAGLIGLGGGGGGATSGVAGGAGGAGGNYGGGGGGGASSNNGDASGAGGAGGPGAVRVITIY